MPPVNPSTNPPEVDNEATAELPILDITAYETTLNEPGAHTDTWVLPAAAAVVESKPLADARPVPDLEMTAEFPHRLESSVTMEMPSLPPFRKTDKVARVTAKPAAAKPPVAKSAPVAVQPAVAVPAAIAPAAVAPVSAPVPAPVTPAAAAPPAPRVSTTGSFVVPPSPPMIEELNERARIADVERTAAVARAQAETAQLREQLGLDLEKLQTFTARLGVQRTDETELQDELFRRADRIKQLEAEIARQSQVIDEKIGLLGTSVRRGETLDAEIVNLRASIARRDSQIAIIEADLQARSNRERELSARLSDALAKIDPNIPDLRRDIDARDEQIRRLTVELKSAQSQLTEKSDDLVVAEESIRNLENDVRDKSGKLEEASVTVEEWRAVIAESQRSILQRDSRIQQLETDLEKKFAATLDTATGSPAASTAQTGEEIALEGPARVLIRTDGNTDFVHVLGRRTRIGRGNDNELVLDTKHVSRYHCVLLAGPVHTSIEDLNSTNGVFVNGKRVSRQVLKDGDRVTVGRTNYRYTVRD